MKQGIRRLSEFPATIRSGNCRGNGTCVREHVKKLLNLPKLSVNRGGGSTSPYSLNNAFFFFLIFCKWFFLNVRPQLGGGLQFLSGCFYNGEETKFTCSLVQSLQSNTLYEYLNLIVCMYVCMYVYHDLYFFLVLTLARHATIVWNYVLYYVLKQTGVWTSTGI